MQGLPATWRLLLGVSVFLNVVFFIAVQPWSWKPRSHRAVKGRATLYQYTTTATNQQVTSVSTDWEEKNLQFRQIFKYAPLCPETSGMLLGELTVDLSLAEASYWDMTDSDHSKVHASNTSLIGRPVRVDAKSTQNVTVFESDTCRSTYTVAIIIPFRHRELHLKYLLGHLLPILQRQLLRYSIIVVSQFGESTFNKGRLMNTAFEYAASSGTHYDCFIFHDVDLLVEHDTLLYKCEKDDAAVRHFSTSIDIYDYKAMCCGITVGGVIGFTENQYRKLNGYSNVYWGWGGEDDDMNGRISHHKMWRSRPNAVQGRYTMIKHELDSGNKKGDDRHKKLREANTRFSWDGLSNLTTKVVRVDRFPLFTNVIVDVGSET